MFLSGVLSARFWRYRLKKGSGVLHVFWFYGGLVVGRFLSIRIIISPTMAIAIIIAAVEAMNIGV